MKLDISLAPETLFYIGSVAISNSFFWLLVLTFFILVGVFFLNRSLKMRPGKVQNVFEMLLAGAFDFVETTVGSKSLAQKTFPLVFTLFFFILVSNLITFIPGQAAVTIETAGGVVPLFRAIIADYSLVFMMTMLSVLITQIVAIYVAGPFRYLGRFLNFTSPLNFFLGLMDLIGEVAKVMSLSFRLFGNIFAGEVLGAVMLFLFPFFLPLPFAFLGLLTAVVQAFVFAVLTLVFISMAATVSEESEAA
ncbi:MAG: FoF1 ATP synthase subunit a [bacterium]|nr:FoF1 ATP synthase subunit a [bacterium]